MTAKRATAAPKPKRPATRKPKTLSAPAPAHLPAVRVRMYRQGLGDCFLLTFDPGGDPRHVLIDCGTLGATTTGVKLADVVADIRKTTGDHLHLVIATHEHWDHLAGFAGQQSEFKKIKVDHVWLAWTENPDDPLAQKIAKSKRDLAVGLVTASQALTSASASPQSAALGLFVRDLLGFFGDVSAPSASGEVSQQLNDAMTFVRTSIGPPATYLMPGQPPIAPDWLPGFRVYVLGPPHDETALNDVGEQGSSDLYGLTAGLRDKERLDRAAEAAVDAPANARNDNDIEQPFAAYFRRPLENGVDAVLGAYFEAADAWRRVDDEWLRVASDLALQLDNLTNNTSVALAIERIADGKVLLFPADAQQGNWRSWHRDDMTWTVDAGGSPNRVNAKQLLARTVFYKVGHHASHNATAKGKGLELMDQESELTAFIPVDRAVALKRNPPGSWKMPARPLYRRLLEKCQGRVVRSDLGWADDAAQAANPAVEQEFAGLGTPADWTAWKRAQQAASHVQVGNLYVDYTLA